MQTESSNSSPEIESTSKALTESVPKSTPITYEFIDYSENYKLNLIN